MKITKAQLKQIIVEEIEKLNDDKRTEVGHSLEAFMNELGGEMGPTVGGIRYIKFRTYADAKKAKKALDVARVKNPELTRGIVVTLPSMQPKSPEFGGVLQVKRGRDYRRG